MGVFSVSYKHILLSKNYSTIKDYVVADILITQHKEDILKILSQENNCQSIDNEYEGCRWRIETNSGAKIKYSVSTITTYDGETFKNTYGKNAYIHQQAIKPIDLYYKQAKRPTGPPPQGVVTFIEILVMIEDVNGGTAQKYYLNETYSGYYFYIYDNSVKYSYDENYYFYQKGINVISHSDMKEGARPIPHETIREIVAKASRAFFAMNDIDSNELHSRVTYSLNEMELKIPSFHIEFNYTDSSIIISMIVISMAFFIYHASRTLYKRRDGDCNIEPWILILDDKKVVDYLLYIIGIIYYLVAYFCSLAAYLSILATDKITSDSIFHYSLCIVIFTFIINVMSFRNIVRASNFINFTK